MTVTVKTAPPVEPVTLAEARSHLRLVASGSPASHPDDTYVERLIAAARNNAEGYMGRTIIETEYEWKFNQFPSLDASLVFPRDTVLSVQSIAYIDDNGDSQSFTDYSTSFADYKSIIVPSYGNEWPVVRGHLNDITITFKAGYAADSSPTDYRANVPEAIKQAILLLVGHFYENREQVMTDVRPEQLPMGFQWLLHPYRVPGL